MFLVVKLVDTKDLKSLPFWECQLNLAEGTKNYNYVFKNVLFIFKDENQDNNDFWSDKFRNKYNVYQFFINDYLNLSNSKIISSINKNIILNKLFNCMKVISNIINYNFINGINKKLN